MYSPSTVYPDFFTCQNICENITGYNFCVFNNLRCKTDHNKSKRSSQFVQQWSWGRYFHTYFCFQTKKVDQAGAGRRQVLLHPGDVTYGHAGL